MDYICEYDGCGIEKDAALMVQLGEAWYCPLHAAVVDKDDEDLEDFRPLLRLTEGDTAAYRYRCEVDACEVNNFTESYPALALVAAWAQSHVSATGHAVVVEVSR